MACESGTSTRVPPPPSVYGPGRVRTSMMASIPRRTGDITCCVYRVFRVAKDGVTLGSVSSGSLHQLHSLVTCRLDVGGLMAKTLANQRNTTSPQQSTCFVAGYDVITFTGKPQQLPAFHGMMYLVLQPCIGT